MTRAGSRKDVRPAPYKKGQSSSGLTKYMGETTLDFDEGGSKESLKKKKSTEKATAPEVGTVVVSCSALILESKQIVNDTDVSKKLDALYAKHKSKEITPQQALEQLATLVGQTTVEQAGLVLSNIQTGTLPAGSAAFACTLAARSPARPLPCSLAHARGVGGSCRWVEYFDPQRNLPYYHNARTKTTTWQKPSKSKQPPPPPPPPASRVITSQASPRQSVRSEPLPGGSHGQGPLLRLVALPQQSRSYPAAV